MKLNGFSLLGLIPVLFFTCGTAHAQAVPASVNGISFPVKTAGGAHSPTEWNIWSNGYIAQPVNFTTPGTYEISINAIGNVAANVWPNMQVTVNNAVKLDIAVSSAQRSTYKFSLPVAAAGTQTIAINFTNDAIINGQDRNLIVSSMGIARMADAPAAPRNAFSFLNASSFNARNGGLVTWDKYVGQIMPGDWLRYDNVDFGAGADQFTASLSVDSQNAGQAIQVRMDSVTGPVLASLNTSSTGGWNTYVRQSAAMANVTGVHALYVTFSGYGGIANLEGFQFQKVGSAAPAPGTPITLKTSFYVSAAAGNDSWSGKLPAPNAGNTDGPFKTLTRARDAMRAGTLKLATIENGTYSVNPALTLNAQDSGESWVAYPGHSPVLDGAGTGGITLDGANNITIKGLNFRSVGKGISMTSSTGNDFEWNSFDGCNPNCVYANWYSGRTTVSNNVMKNGGSTETYHAAIYFNFNTSDNVISRNSIENFQGPGISISAGPTETNNNNLIDRNIVRNANTNMRDSGAIYMMDRSHKARGNRITNNFIDLNGNAMTNNDTKCIYLDDQTSWVTVTGNVGRRCGQYGLQIHGGDNNVFQNNVFDLSSGAKVGIYQDNAEFGNNGMGGNTFTGNIVYSDGGFAQPLWDFLNQSGVPIASPIVTNNMYYSATGAAISTGGVISDAAPVRANPGFANPAGGNYGMPSSSPAFTQIGFKALATDYGPLPRPDNLQ